MTQPTSRRAISERIPRSLWTLGAGALVAVGLARALLFLVLAGFEIATPNQPFHLEGASIHFAWRAQHGLPLYPQPAGASYAVNYMGPCYFALVGGIGRLCNADLDGLFLIGRWTTFLCGLLPAGIAAVYLNRRYGRWPALAGLVFGLGSGPMVAFGVASRPDMMADLLGAAGFFVAACLASSCRFRAAKATAQERKESSASSSDYRWFAVAVALLALGCLTKQTAIVWLLAAMLVLWLRDGARWQALALGAGTAAVVVAIIAILTAAGEPYAVSSLLSQSVAEFDLQQQLGVVLLLFKRSPEILFFVLLGCGFWCTGEYKDRTMLILAVVLLSAGLLACAKQGSDLNYFLSLRIVEAIAAGTLCAAALRPGRHLVGMAVLAAAAALTMLPSTLFAAKTAVAVIRQGPPVYQADPDASPSLARWVQLAECEDVRMLTDSDRLAVHQGTRAAFLDCYFFRLRADAGRIDLGELLARLQSRWYQYVVLSADASGKYRDNYFYRLPEPVAAAIRENYELASHEPGLFVYEPRKR